jgi:predicted O-methyltransferase YrrM
MLPKVIEAYSTQGYGVDMGNPTGLYSCLIEKSTGRSLSTGGGITVSDAFLFSIIARMYNPAAVFVIGNAFGLSTFVLAESFPGALIDVIDAEAEGSDNARGSEVTRKIAQSHFPTVRLTTGFSPQDISKACRVSKYQMAFIDGLHTNEQMVKDFIGLSPFLDDQCVVVFHDVASHNMLDGWKEIVNLSAKNGFHDFQVSWTSFGVCVLVRGLPTVQQYFESCAGSFRGIRYYLGLKSSPHRPKFYNRTLYEIELYIRKKLGFKV